MTRDRSRDDTGSAAPALLETLAASPASVSGCEPTLAASPASVSGCEPTLAPGALTLDDTLAPDPSAPPGGAVIRARKSRDHDELRVVDPENYALGSELARGGMGRIRHARDLRLHRPVAVKELLASDRSLADRFEREILLTARLQHPSIVSIYEAGRWPSGEPFYAMRVVPGRSLDAVIEPLTTLAERLALLPNVIAVAEALAYAHSQRVIHRDLKPANILIGPFGESVVIDWGLAKDLAATEPADAVAATPYRAAPDDGLTMVGSVMGTPAYMPPEQAEGEAVDERADVYALGAILYHLLGGRPPFTGTSSDELLVQVLTRSPTPLAPDVPRDLLAIVDKAMARAAADRYATAGELATDLKRFQTGQLVGAHSYSRWALVRRWVRRHRGAVGVGALAIIALAVTGIVSVRNVMSERDLAQRARVEADRAKDEAIAASARLYLDQGRQELLAGNPLRAAALLHASLERADRSVTRLLVGQALEPLAPFAQSYDGMQDSVIEVGFSPDDASVFAAAWHGRVTIWNTATGAPQASFDKGSMMSEVVMSPDGATLATLQAEDQFIELWDTRSGQRRATLAIGEGLAFHVRFSPDGTRLAAAGGSLSIWNTTSLALVATVDALPGDLIAALAWSPDGSRLAVGGGSLGGLAIVETTGWTNVLTTRARAEPGRFPAVVDVTFSPDGRRLAYVASDLGDILDARTGKVITAIDGADQQWANSYRSVRFSADGGALALSTIATNAKLVDAATGKTRRLFGKYASAIFSADGTTVLASATSAGTAALWDVKTGRLLGELSGPSGITTAAFSRDGRFVLTGDSDGTIERWNVRGEGAVTRSKLRKSSHTATYSPDGRWLVIGHDDGTIDLLDAVTGVLVRTLGEPVTRGIVSDPFVELGAGGRLLTVLGKALVAQIWDPATGTLLSSFDAGVPIRRAGFVGDSQVYTATAESLTIWEVARGTVVASFAYAVPPKDRAAGTLTSGEFVLPPHHAKAAVMADGRHVLIPVAGGLAVIEISSKRQLAVLPYAGDVWSTLVSPAGPHIAVLGSKGAALFDVDARRQLSTLAAQSETVSDLRFTSDGRSLYTYGGTIRRWDVHTGELALTFDLQKRGRVLFAMLPNSTVLATFNDNVASLWDVATGKLLVERDTGLDPLNGTATLLALSADGRRLLASTYDTQTWTWTLPSWTGTPAALGALLACRVPWKIVDGAVMPRGRDATCD